MASEMDQITMDSSTVSSLNIPDANIPRRPHQLSTIKRYFFFVLLIKICSIAWTVCDIIAIASIYVDDDYDDYYAIRWTRFKSIAIPKYLLILIFELIGTLTGWITYISDNRSYLGVHIAASIIAFTIEVGTLIVLHTIRGYIKLIDVNFIIIAIKFYQRLKRDAKMKRDASNEPVDANKKSTRVTSL